MCLALGCGGGGETPGDPDAGSPDAYVDPPDAWVQVGTPQVCVNEIMASSSFSHDVNGERPDWIELYNGGDGALNLDGWSITDDLTVPDKHVFDGLLLVPAGGYLLLYPDNGTTGGQHLSFELDKQGDELYLFSPTGQTRAAIRFGAQLTDWSSVRDGAGTWFDQRNPTPGASNGASQCEQRDDLDPNEPEEVPAWPDPSPELYDVDTIQEFRIELSPSAYQSLELNPYSYVEGTLIFEGRRYSPVGVRLKGQGSFLPIGQKPSLKIKFGHYVSGGEFFGLKKLTLNNMSSDPTMMHERLAYSVYRKMGIPAPRANHTRVYLNNSYYGLYANIEDVDRRMLAHWFTNSDGPLFEGWDTDFIPGYETLFQHEDGPDDRTNIYGLADALSLGDPNAAIAAALDHADVDQFLWFWAVTSAVGQFDAYPYNIDDFHVYDDPIEGTLQFIPWGTDETFDDNGNVRWIGGQMALRCAEVPSCVQTWADRMFDVVDEMEAMDLYGEIDRIIAQTATAVAEDTRKPYSSFTMNSYRTIMRTFIETRRDTITQQLEGM